MFRPWVLIAALPLLLIGQYAMAESSPSLQNDRYRVQIQADGGFVVSTPNADPAAFQPVFTVFHADKDPQLALRPAGLKRVSYNVPTWVATGTTGNELGNVNRNIATGDGFDPAILAGDKEGRTADVFRAAPAQVVRASGMKPGAERIEWTFAARDDFEFSATLHLPQGTAEPRITFKLTPRQDGFYSVGFNGSPESDSSAIEEMWQPLIWTEKRFPERAYLTAAFHCPVPAPMVSASGTTVGLIVEPGELPFQPLPTFANSRFGIAVRNAAGKAQPAVFAPILGGTGSKMQSGQSFEFSFRVLVHPGGCIAAQEHVARDIYGFKDIRENTLCSLNTALENMIDYGLSEYSRFNEDLRGCAYDTDAPGTVKNVSALHPLSLAVVTDNPDIYSRRARPIMEYLLSREKFLFSVDPNIKTQSPGWRLTGPCAPLSEFAALYLFSNKRTPLFLHEAGKMIGKERVLNLDDKQEGDSWQNSLALYRASGDPKHLEEAKKRADGYLKDRLETAQTDFSDPAAVGMFFWSSFAPAWIELLELYEETGEKRYLDAAHQGARRYCQYTWTSPRIPETDVLVNEGGVAPEYWYLKDRGLGPIRVPEESVPAWRVAETGLVCESSGTASGHRGVMLANHAPWMLRLAALTGDEYLHDIGRSAIIGRYANFPGYHINTARTTVYEKPDYPLRPFRELTYNSIHFNHIWPHMAMVLDYLVSDAYFRSGGEISFPSRYAEGYAYLKSKVYGDRPGEFYDEKGVWLWMPKGLIQSDSVQLNYVAARGDQSLYVAFCNQSAQRVDAVVSFDAQQVDIPSDKPATVRLWRDNQPAEPIPFQDGKLKVSVAGRGITAIAIDGVMPRLKFQEGFRASASPLPEQSVVTLPFGRTKGMLLSMGPNLTHAYVYLGATFQEMREATLHYRTTGDWQTAKDAAYPYEFTVELDKQDSKFEFFVEGIDVDGQTGRSENATLRVR